MYCYLRLGVVRWAWLPLSTPFGLSPGYFFSPQFPVAFGT